jgi:hypothetical protein
VNRVLAGCLVAVAVLVGIGVLRRITMTVHTSMPAGSRLVVEASARWKGSRESAENHARALTIACVSETSAPAELREFTWRDDGRFRFVVTPGFDEPDRRQLRGCMSDLRMPELLVDVRHVRTTGAGGR